VKIYEFFGDYVRGNVKENRPSDAGLLNGKISILLERLILGVWGENVKTQSRRVINLRDFASSRLVNNELLSFFY
jgi:hypothetical protein